MIPGLGRSPGGGHGSPLQYACLEDPHGQRSLVDCSAWGRKESETTGRRNRYSRLASSFGVRFDGGSVGEHGARIHSLRGHTAWKVRKDSLLIWQFTWKVCVKTPLLCFHNSCSIRPSKMSLVEGEKLFS